MKRLFSDLRAVKFDAAPYFIESNRRLMRRTDALEKLLLAPTTALLPRHVRPLYQLVLSSTESGVVLLQLIRYNCCMNHEELRRCRKDLLHNRTLWQRFVNVLLKQCCGVDDELSAGKIGYGVCHHAHLNVKLHRVFIQFL